MFNIIEQNIALNFVLKMKLMPLKRLKWCRKHSVINLYREKLYIPVA